MINWLWFQWDFRKILLTTVVPRKFGTDRHGLRVQKRIERGIVHGGHMATAMLIAAPVFHLTAALRDTGWWILPDLFAHPGVWAFSAAMLFVIVVAEGLVDRYSNLPDSLFDILHYSVVAVPWLAGDLGGVLWCLGSGLGLVTIYFILLPWNARYG